MRCSICKEKAERFCADGSAICEECAKKQGYTLCTETGTYINFTCSFVCSDCEMKENN